eukprot:GEMP01021344.1.p1 GENE.GEMP01021344.1~~GEMP01021344.1.p1  ORF type:complete len:686 (+),score=191.16 GEMP01021344.1:177-2234(+)
MDRRLSTRIDDIVLANNSRDPEVIVDALRSNFREYERKKRNLLKQVVTQYMNDRQVEQAEEMMIGDAVGSTDKADKNDKENMNTQLTNLYKKTLPLEDAKEPKPLDDAKEPKPKRRRVHDGLVLGSAQEKFAPEERPTLRLEDMGGIDAVFRDVQDLIIYPLTRPEVLSELGVLPPTGVLLHGAPGSGKTMLAHAIAGTCGVPFFNVAAPEIVNGVSGESEAKLRSLFEEVANAAPSLLFIDEVDCIAPRREQTERQMDRRIVAQLLKCLDGLKGKPVVVLGATNCADTIDSSLRRSGRFDREIAMGIPDLKARKRILEVITKNIRLGADVNLDDLAFLTPGFVGADLSSLTQEAGMRAQRRIIAHLDSECVEPSSEVDRKYSEVSMADFEEAAKRVQPSSKREGFSTVPDVTWDNVGALAELRRELEQAICEPIRKAELFKSVGITVPCGCLLFGPPGCGKTLLAKAVANASGANFISVKGPELLNKYVGESERAVRQVFQRAQTSAPCVIFFDELDALVPKRSSEGSSSSERVVNQMLTEMDGMNTRRDVFVIGATNRPDIIDNAMMRPGRLDRLLYVPLPTYEGRLDILKTLTKKTPLDGSVNFERISERTDGFSGADLAGLTREATLVAIRNASEPAEGETPKIIVRMEEFEESLGKVGPSISAAQRDEYLELAKRLKRVL